MKNLRNFAIIAISIVSFSSCGLFSGGGGGGHCPAYGSSIDNSYIPADDINNAEELRLKESVRM